MIELKIVKNNDQTSEQYGKYYPRVAYKKTLGIHDMAVHMAEHQTPFSEGTIEGILRDLVKCIREQTLNGNTVKIDNLAIFKCSVVGNATNALYDRTNDVTIRAAIGAKTAKDPKTGVVKPTGNAVKSMKLLAQATGEYTREELNKDATLGWTDLAQKIIDDAKNEQPEP